MSDEATVELGSGQSVSVRVSADGMAVWLTVRDQEDAATACLSPEAASGVCSLVGAVLRDIGRPMGETMAAEARRRGVSYWQVRREHGATWANPSTGAYRTASNGRRP